MPGDRGEEKTPRVVFFSVVIGIVLLDQLTKYLTLTFLSGVQTFPLVSGIFHLTLVYNPGIAFGFFRQHESLLKVFITLSIVILIFYAGRSGVKTSASEARRPWEIRSKFGLAMILGGALGNWIDRVRVSAVIDFLDFRVWPVFNLADSAITVGVALYLWAMLFGNRGQGGRP